MSTPEGPQSYIDSDSDDSWIGSFDKEPRDSAGRTQEQRLRAAGYTGSVVEMLRQKATAEGWDLRVHHVVD